MILSTNQFLRDYDDSPELRAIDLSSVDGTYTLKDMIITTLEEENAE